MDFLIRFNLDLFIPASSTIGELYKKHGLIEVRVKRRRVALHSKPLAHCNKPNAV